MLDTGPLLLAFTEEENSDKVRQMIKRHEAREIELFVHPNNLVEAYKVISMIKRDKPELLRSKGIDPKEVVRSAYATLSVIQDESATLHLAEMKLKHHDKPWGDISSAALAISLSNDEEKVSVIILNHERHFKDMEVNSIRVSEL